MQVFLSGEAELDIEEIGDYIASDNPSRALSFVDELRWHFDKIARFPSSYVLRRELGEGIRTCAHGRYLIVFRQEDDELLIVRVLHMSRDLQALMRGDS